MKPRKCVLKDCDKKEVKKEFVCREHLQEHGEIAKQVNGVFCSVCGCELPEDFITTLCYGCG